MMTGNSGAPLCWQSGAVTQSAVANPPIRVPEIPPLVLSGGVFVDCHRAAPIDTLLLSRVLIKRAAVAVRFDGKPEKIPTLIFSEGGHDVFPDDPTPVAFRRHPYRPDNSARDGGPGHRTPLRQGRPPAHQQ